MAKVKKFDRPTLRKFREDFASAVKSFADKNGVVISLGNIKFSDAQFTAKMEVVLAPNASGMSAQEVIGRKSLDLEGVFFGLTADDYGRTFKNWDGKLYKLTGVKSSRPKYPIVAEQVGTGKTYKFGEDVIQKLSKVKK